MKIAFFSQKDWLYAVVYAILLGDFFNVIWNVFIPAYMVRSLCVCHFHKERTFRFCGWKID